MQTVAAVLVVEPSWPVEGIQLFLEKLSPQLFGTPDHCRYLSHKPTVGGMDLFHD